MKFLESKKKYINFGKIGIVEVDPVENIDLSWVFSELFKFVPNSFVDGLVGIYFGDFPELKERKIKSYLSDNVIVISNNLKSEKELIKILVHELAHNIERNNKEDLYSNKEILKEFLSKRRVLADRLKLNGVKSIPRAFIENPDFLDEIDHWLMDVVGYDRLNLSITSLFPDVYSVTSVREYFACCFEIFFLENKKEVETMAPAVYNAISDLVRE